MALVEIKSQKHPVDVAIDILAEIYGITVKRNDKLETSASSVPDAECFMMTPHGMVAGWRQILRYFVTYGNRIQAKGTYGFTETPVESDNWMDYLGKNLCCAFCCPNGDKSKCMPVMNCLNERLEDSTYITGNYPGMCDIFCFVIMKTYISEYSRPIKRWMDTMNSIPIIAEKTKNITCLSPAKTPIAQKSIDPDNAFSIEEFKKIYGARLDMPYEEFIHQAINTGLQKLGYSWWLMKYEKLDGECTVDYITRNQMAGFFQRGMATSVSRKSMAVCHTVGSDSCFDIIGVWLCEGYQLPEDLKKEHPSFEYHEWTQLDFDNPADKSTIMEIFFHKEGEKVQGKPVYETILFR